MLAEVDRAAGIDRSALGALLTDAEPEVVAAALAALRWPDDEPFLESVPGHLGHRRTAGAAVEALVRAGDAVLPVVDEGLGEDARGRHAQELLVRAGREIGGPDAVSVLVRHVDHRDREVGLAVMTALAALGPADAGHDPSGRITPLPDVTEPVVRSDLEHAAHILQALVAFADDTAATELSAALRDELTLVRRRILAAFSMRHGTEGFTRVVFQLAQRDSRAHALALEWLDVTLTSAERPMVAILEPRLADVDRLNALLRSFPVPARSRREILMDLVEDPEDRWRRPWLAACALSTAWTTAEVAPDAIATAATSRATVGDDDGEILSETLAELRRRRLAPDPGP
jgi:hypothetical protein